MKNCILINKENPITKKMIDKINLIETEDIFGNKVKVEEETFNAYLDFKEYLKSINIEIGISSAYRSLAKQQETLDFYMEKEGKEYCERYVAPIGCSEHHSGLAIDFYIKHENGYPKDDIEVINNPKEYEEIHNVLQKFGFILRYPKGKEEITGYEYEPWHIRYVGKNIAKIIMDNNITLEEYKDNFQGVIVINKKKGMTSYSIVEKISKLLGIKKVGHTGTLDPLAEGVLIICIGKATKIVELLTAEDKEYIAEAKLGIKTDTYDIEGKIIDRKDVNKDIKIEDTIKSFQKTYLQEVPIYSAIKVNGKKLYEYARNNEEVVLPKKEVTIKEIELLDHEDDTFKFKAKVTKGCYIRSLINDIGEELNTYATMVALTRTKQGNVSIDEAYTLEDFENNNYKIYSIEEVLDYPIIVVDEEVEKQIHNGMKIEDTFNIKDKVIFKNKDNKLLGIYEKDNNNLKVWKNFN